MKGKRSQQFVGVPLYLRLMPMKPVLSGVTWDTF